MCFNKGNAEFRANAVSVAALILTLASCNGTVVLIK
jgi:hypothetical protein